MAKLTLTWLLSQPCKQLMWQKFALIQFRSLGASNLGRLKSPIFLFKKNLISLYPFNPKNYFGPKRNLEFLTLSPHFRLLSNPSRTPFLQSVWLLRNREFFISYLRFFDLSFFICDTKNFLGIIFESQILYFTFRTYFNHILSNHKKIKFGFFSRSVIFSKKNVVLS